MTTYRVTHETVYRYADVATLSFHAAHLRPRGTGWQRCRDFELTVRPEPLAGEWRTDFFGNEAYFCAVRESHRELRVVARGVVEVERPEWPKAEGTPGWEKVRAGLDGAADWEWIRPHQFRYDSPHVPLRGELGDYALVSFPAGRPVLAGAEDLRRRIHADFIFDPTATSVSTPVEEVFARRRGVCQDFAHLQIACLRSMGLAARYVSGYLRTTPPPGRERLVGADASHAWVGVFCGPEAGWVDQDPTNDVATTEDHITLAWGRDYSDVAPLRGVVASGGGHSLAVGVTVEPWHQPVDLERR